MSLEFLWYIPNQVTAGHRSDTTVAGHNSLQRLTARALTCAARTAEPSTGTVGFATHSPNTLVTWRTGI